MRVPTWVLPFLIILCAGIGIGGARLLVMPSVVKNYASPPAGASLATTILVIDGLKCVDTAERAAGQLEGVPGVVSFTAFASRNRAEIVFDSNICTVNDIINAIEGPVYNASTGEFLFGVYRIVEADGVQYAAK
ncbi:MAG TPA: heavy-metal-associated domain-containing protein [Thermoanaerobaculia bacterium]|nr:heavy-metal-associated domain-containing protein [Thermoanaerobaculia bacterium]HUM29759.1 heavy-metal-associated domain-containing protein [Thermoanaerobaculia bacterium]HXK67059.1 heavy-metal-associated domain-containing protein [Thermoanaerobaculia bacterium]